MTIQVGDFTETVIAWYVIEGGMTPIGDRVKMQRSRPARAQHDPLPVLLLGVHAARKWLITPKSDQPLFWSLLYLGGPEGSQDGC